MTTIKYEPIDRMLLLLLRVFSRPAPSTPKAAAVEHAYREGMTEAAYHALGAYTPAAVKYAVMDVLRDFPPPAHRPTDSAYPAERDGWEWVAVKKLRHAFGLDDTQEEVKQ